MNPDIRYSRQIALPSIGVSGQAKLRDASVLIIGAGGLGTAASTYLASSGVGQLLINDFDRIDLSNLPRQVLYRSSDKGAHKARIAAERLQAINPATDVISLEERLPAKALAECIAAVDAVVDCTDNFGSRWLINEYCFRQHKPLISGAAIRWEGQVSVFRNAASAGPCYRCLYSEADENLDDCTGQGIVAPVAGMVGCMLATETLKVLLGIESALHGKLWVYDGLAGNSRTVTIPARQDCPVCGTQSRCD